MKAGIISAAMFFVSTALLLGACCKTGEMPSLWELKCSSCHDGKTVLNDQVVPDKKDLRNKYKNIEQFMMSCLSAPACMNILKHDEELFRQVGLEIGIPE